jgi:hexosaminidase
MPGHSTAALAAYPWLSCTGGPFDVGEQWGVYQDVFCTKDSVFDFLEDVLTEVCDLFPGKYIHIGGDESPKTRWKECPRCQAVMKREGLKDEQELQSYFVQRIEKFLNSKGKIAIGWDEILEGGVAANATVMSWRGTEGGIEAARQKHDVVMTPAGHCYFDYYQADPAYEPLAIGGYCPIDTVYSYEPTPAELSPDEDHYILGAQGNVWTEYMTTPQKVEYMALPRMAALAEVVWSPRSVRDYNDFRRRLVAHLPVLSRLGVNYSRAVYGVDLQVLPPDNGEGVVVRLTSAFDSTGLHYSLDGSDPRPFSSGYSGPFKVGRSTIIKAGYFDHDDLVGPVITQEITVSKSTGKKVTLATLPSPSYSANGPFTLVDGIRGDTTRHNRQWLGWQGPDMEAVIDLGDGMQISRVTMDVFDGAGSWIYPPKAITVSCSENGDDYTVVQSLSTDEIKKRGNVIEMAFDPREARFVKVVAENAGKIPDGQPGAGNDSWLFVDEIMVR